jgi:hypothetical protein
VLQEWDKARTDSLIIRGAHPDRYPAVA